MADSTGMCRARPRHRWYSIVLSAWDYRGAGASKLLGCNSCWSRTSEATPTMNQLTLPGTYCARAQACESQGCGWGSSSFPVSEVHADRRSADRGDGVLSAPSIASSLRDTSSTSCSAVIAPARAMRSGRMRWISRNASASSADRDARGVSPPWMVGMVPDARLICPAGRSSCRAGLSTAEDTEWAGTTSAGTNAAVGGLPPPPEWAAELDGVRDGDDGCEGGRGSTSGMPSARGWPFLPSGTWNEERREDVSISPDTGVTRPDAGESSSLLTSGTTWCSASVERLVSRRTPSITSRTPPVKHTQAVGPPRTLYSS